MAYKRFLVDNDYLPVLTEEHMKQLIRDVHDRIPMAEQSAEMNMLEYLDQYYEIEKELRRGKSIYDYHATITYPAGVYFVYDGKICKSLSILNGRKTPSLSPYWNLIEDYTNIDVDSIAKYSQLKTYMAGDMVKYGTEIYSCLQANGYDLETTELPNVTVWRQYDAQDWEANEPYELKSVVKYDDNYYTLLSEPEDLTVNPEDDDAWGLIGEYSEDYEYTFSDDSADYVVYDGYVFYPVLDPNATTPELGKNIIADDPRNINVITHMVRLSVYYLHQLISPTNISETRRLAYEDSMNWLMLASKFKLNPQIPRKINKDDGRATTDWAIETFQRSFDPNENPWLI